MSESLPDGSSRPFVSVSFGGLRREGWSNVRAPTTSLSRGVENDGERSKSSVEVSVDMDVRRWLTSQN